MKIFGIELSEWTFVSGRNLGGKYDWHFRSSKDSIDQNFWRVYICENHETYKGCEIRFDMEFSELSQLFIQQYSVPIIYKPIDDTKQIVDTFLIKMDKLKAFQ